MLEPENYRCQQLGAKFRRGLTVDMAEGRVRPRGSANLIATVQRTSPRTSTKRASSAPIIDEDSDDFAEAPRLARRRGASKAAAEEVDVESISDGTKRLGFCCDGCPFALLSDTS